MPIKDKSRYPANWKEIRKRILRRAVNRCELCGVMNHSWIQRKTYCRAWWQYSEPQYEADEVNAKPIKVVLTVAHINQDPSDNRDCNLRALCQRCHNIIDLPYRVDNVAKTRRKKKEPGQERMWDER